eukprot:scaffold386_cov174-Ochromonas_danica.AAC.23
MEKLKGYCQEELKTFLKEKTIPFVDNLFEALQDGSYRDVALSAAPSSRERDSEQNDREGEEEEDANERRRSNDEDDDWDNRKRRRYSDTPDQMRSRFEEDNRQEENDTSSSRMREGHRDRRDDRGRERDQQRGGAGWERSGRDRERGDRGGDSRDYHREGDYQRGGYNNNNNHNSKRRYDDYRRDNGDNGRNGGARYQNNRANRPPPPSGTGYPGPQPPFPPYMMPEQQGQQPWPVTPGYLGVYPGAMPGNGQPPPPPPFWPSYPGAVPSYSPPPPGYFYGNAPPPYADVPSESRPIPPVLPPSAELEPTNPVDKEAIISTDGFGNDEVGEGVKEDGRQGAESAHEGDLTAAENASGVPVPSILPSGAPVVPHYMSMMCSPEGMGYPYRYDYGMGGYQPQNRANQRRQSGGSERRAQANQLPEHERCTLRCTGIPHYVKEEDIRKHFEAFGGIVELQLSPMTSDTKMGQQEEVGESGEKKKTYNECLVQFYSALNAKRCLSSPLPVLNNRFIHVYQSSFNIVPPSDVSPPSAEIIERDQMLLAQEHINPNVVTSGKPKASSSSSANFQAGVTNKWRRPTSSANATVPSGLETENAEFVKDNSSEIVPNEEEKAESSSAPAPATAVVKKEDTELKETFVQLKALTQQNEEILKRKESIILTQMEECRKMVEKLEASPDSESKAALLHKLEGKIVDLQGQLRTVRDELNKPVGASNVAEKMSPPPKFMGRGRGRGGRGYYPNQNAYNPGRAYGRGGRAFYGRMNGRGESTLPGRGNPFALHAPQESLADGENALVSEADLDSQLATVSNQLDELGGPETDAELEVNNVQ